MNISLKPIAMTMLLATAPFAGAAHATAPAAPAAPSTVSTKAAKAQLQADEAALSAEEMQLRADEAKQKADRAAGRLAGMSPDALKVYKDQQAIERQTKVIALDEPRSLQWKADRAALRIEEKLLAADKAALRTDKIDGKMAAQSEDSERVYQDLQSINGEKKDIAADRAHLRDARKG
jgi:hypothetical protein